ncbi:cytochrome c oxidase assembly protein [Actinomycetospora cinnamomea]|uniref:Putative copper resistance protein D n=1 Tax=Actinomycetospora cinnamomea TaxID=663609 RepID=A0A2U1EVC0_9PSEU|nr:cytochrome c oxidase assembly protein [Actinomycetospora cinnamomea]PVZ03893.1 putative copper resistance protein D [Actinomycetospora cinnamomea]
MSPTSPDAPAPTRAAAPAVAGAALVALVLVAVAAVLRGGAPYAALEVTVPPVLVQVATPLLRLTVLLAAGTCLGGLVGALVARPSRGGARVLGAHGFRAARVAGAAAVVWAVAALAAALSTVLAGTGADVAVLRRPEAILVSAGALEEPVGFLVAAALATVVAAMCRITLSWRTVAGAVPLAALAVAAPVVAGQVASAGAGHDIATDAAALAAVAGAVWLGLAVLEAVAPCPAPGRDRDPDRATAPRARPVALAAAGVTIAATVVVEAVLLRGVWPTGLHGALAVVQLVLLLGAAGLTLRRRVPGPAVASVLVLAAGAGALLATEPPPALTTWIPTTAATVQEILLGYTLDPPTVLALLGPGRLNLGWALVALVVAGAYLAGVAHLRRRGDAWPAGRTAAWIGACALLAWATSSGLGAHAMATFSAHMGVHMLLSMLVPVLLVLGGPVTLALRALPARGGGGGPDGPRDWLVSLIDAPLPRLLTHPVVALVLFVGSFYALYFSPLYATALPYHWAHQAMFVHFLLTGYLFYWPIIGVDRCPRPLPHVGRLALLLASMPFHAFFGVALMSAGFVIGEQFFRQLSLPWVPDLLADQSLGGGLAWAAGEVPVLVVIAALLVQWSRADQRDAARRDRHADRDGDAELAAWNAILADLSRGR